MACCACITAVGYAATAYLFYKFFSSLYNIIYPFFIAAPIGDLLSYCGGKWAVITGSTDGIGKEYAIQLARKGFNIVLIARNDEKLQQTKAEIEAAHSKVDVKTVKFDFSNCSLDDYRNFVGAQIENLDVGILVNNVGLSYDFPQFFAEIPGGEEKARNIAVINTLPAVMLSKLTMEKMSSRGKGVVINIGSGASLTPMPLLAIYSAAKVFMEYFSRVLQAEYGSKGIFVQHVTPFMVATKMSKVRKSSFFVPFPREYVKSAIRTIGIQENTFGFWTHSILGALFSLIPEFLLTKILLSYHLGIRKKAMKKQQQQQKEESDKNK